MNSTFCYFLSMNQLFLSVNYNFLSVIYYCLSVKCLLLSVVRLFLSVNHLLLSVNHFFLLLWNDLNDNIPVTCGVRPRCTCHDIDMSSKLFAKDVWKFFIYAVHEIFHVSCAKNYHKYRANNCLDMFNKSRNHRNYHRNYIRTPSTKDLWKVEVVRSKENCKM